MVSQCRCRSSYQFGPSFTSIMMDKATDVRARRISDSQIASSPLAYPLPDPHPSPDDLLQSDSNRVRMVFAVCQGEAHTLRVILDASYMTNMSQFFETRYNFPVEMHYLE